MISTSLFVLSSAERKNADSSNTMPMQVEPRLCRQFAASVRRSIRLCSSMLFAVLFATCALNSST